MCAKYMKKGTFELGGSDPMIVCEDVDINFVVEKAMKARLGTNGQACNNAKRFFVHESIYDAFIHNLILRLNTDVVIGNPMD